MTRSPIDPFQSRPSSRESAPPPVPPRDNDYSTLNSRLYSIRQNASFHRSNSSHFLPGEQSQSNASSSFLHSTYNNVNMAPRNGRHPLPTPPPPVRGSQLGQTSAFRSPFSTALPPITELPSTTRISPPNRPLNPLNVTMGHLQRDPSINNFPSFVLPPRPHTVDASITVPFHSAFNVVPPSYASMRQPATSLPAHTNASFPLVHHIPLVAAPSQNLHPPAMVQPAPRYPQLGYAPRILTPRQPPVQQVPPPVPQVPVPVPVPPVYTYNHLPYYNVPLPPMQPLAPAEPNLPYGLDRLPSTLPASSLSLIPVLSESKDWTGWNNGVINAVRAIGAMGHLYDTPTNDPLLHPVYPPELPDPLHADYQNHYRSYVAFWKVDAVVLQILTARLGEAPATTIPSASDIAVQRIPARDIYTVLANRYSACDYTDGLVHKLTLWNLRHNGSNSFTQIERYILKWKEGIDYLRRCRYPYTPADAAIQFVLNGPMHIEPWTRLQTTVIDATDQSLIDDDWLTHLFHRASRDMKVHSTTKAVENATRFGSSAPSHRDRDRRPHSTTKVCDDCKMKGKMRCSFCGYDHCEHNHRSGGARRSSMEENKQDSKAVTVKPKAYVAAPLNDVPEEEEMADDRSLEDVATLHVTLGENESVSTYLGVDCFPASFSPDSSPSAFLTGDPTLLAEVQSLFQALLDSACTYHIIKEKALFWTYHPDLSLEVSTASSGTLITKAQGLVKLEVEVQAEPDSLPASNPKVVLSLHDCLHAPGAAMNLLSIGTFIESRMPITFDLDGFARVQFPSSVASLAGRCFCATIKGRLAFLKCKFLLPPNPIPSDPTLPSTALAYALFTPREPDYGLWHERLAHPGIESTKGLLDGSYAEGVSWNHKVGHTRCIACVLGKVPRAPYDHNAHRASELLGLLHMDICGPFPVQGPHLERYFAVILNDYSNDSTVQCLRNRDHAFRFYLSVEARWERQTGKTVKALRVDGAKELIEGRMGTHLTERGIHIQQTAAYAHQQNGKAERFVRTIEDGMRTLVAGSDLPPSYWTYAVLTVGYLRRCLPTKTLPKNQTPYEVMMGHKPNLQHLRVWGCRAYPIQLAEIRGKGENMRYEAVFVAYEENRIGWGCVDLNGKYRFSNDVVFDESSRGRLGTKRRVSSTPVPAVEGPRPLRHSSRVPVPTKKSAQYREDIQRRRDKVLQLHPTPPDDASRPPSVDFIADYAALAFAETVLSQYPSITLDYCPLPMPPVTLATFTEPTSGRTEPPSPDLAQPPASFHLAKLRSDWPRWEDAMGSEVHSLREKGVFEKVSGLPPGRKAIPLMWVYDFKHVPDTGGLKEKARLVVLGNLQGALDHGETYSAVAKATSIRIILAYAAFHRWFIFTFDVKTAFLNAPLEEEVYCTQIPHFPDPDRDTFLRLRKALYGLRQAGRAWYYTLKAVLEQYGLRRCEIDHGVFYGVWSSPPHPSIPMPTDGSPLRLLLPIHVDDGAAATNSAELYAHFIEYLNSHFTISDLGPIRRFLGIDVEYHRERGILRLSQESLIDELLAAHGLSSARPQDIPLRTKHFQDQSVPLTALPGYSDSATITRAYQRIVGSLLYLASWTRPDLAYTVVALAQWNASPTRSTLLAAKGVLRYLLGTKSWRLVYGDSVCNNSIAYCDADWATNEQDRRSISGYAFFMFSGLVSWSSCKQKATALSSTEAEYMSITHASKEALWIRLFCRTIDLPFPRPFRFLSDNDSAISMTKANVVSNRAKHIDLRYHFIREHVSAGTFIINWIPTGDMTADILTKALTLPLHARHAASLGLSTEDESHSNTNQITQV